MPKDKDKDKDKDTFKIKNRKKVKLSKKEMDDRKAHETREAAKDKKERVKGKNKNFSARSDTLAYIKLILESETIYPTNVRSLEGFVMLTLDEVQGLSSSISKKLRERYEA